MFYLLITNYNDSYVWFFTTELQRLKANHTEYTPYTNVAEKIW